MFDKPISQEFAMDLVMRYKQSLLRMQAEVLIRSHERYGWDERHMRDRHSLPIIVVSQALEIIAEKKEWFVGRIFSDMEEVFNQSVPRDPQVIIRLFISSKEGKTLFKEVIDTYFNEKSEYQIVIEDFQKEILEVFELADKKKAEYENVEYVTHMVRQLWRSSTPTFFNSECPYEIMKKVCALGGDFRDVLSEAEAMDTVVNKHFSGNKEAPSYLHAMKNKINELTKSGMGCRSVFLSREEFRANFRSVEAAGSFRKYCKENNIACSTGVLKIYEVEVVVKGEEQVDNITQKLSEKDAEIVYGELGIQKRERENCLVM